MVYFSLASLVLLLEVSTFTLSMTDLSPESEKESSGHDAFLFVSEDHGSNIDHYSSVNNGDEVDSKQGPDLGT